MEIDDFNAIAGAPWKSLWPEKVHADIGVALDAARAGKTGHFSAFCPTAKGTPKWWDVIVTAVRRNDGQIDRLLAVSRDITESHKAANELRASEARFRSLVTAISAVVWNGPASGQFETEQPSWSAFTGQTFDEYRGWGWLDALHPEDRDRTATAWRQALETSSVYQVEHRLRRADAEYRYMSAKGVPVTDVAGEIQEWIGVHTDITAQERLVKEIKAVNKGMTDAFRQAPAFMCVLRGPDHVFEMVNEWITASWK